MHNNSEVTETQLETQFKQSLIAERSFANLYVFEVAQQRWVVKVFPPGSQQLCQRELALLSALSHPNVLRPIALPQSLAARLAVKLNNAFIVFPEAKYGNLLSYIAKTQRGLSERVTAFYLSQIAEALLYAQSMGVNHPNLVLDNVLMEESRSLLLCGWSNALGAKRESATFELAKLGIQLLVGRDPFLGNFVNFLKEPHIHKFWQQTERSSRSLDKTFAFSEQFKSAVEPLLLRKLTDLSEAHKMLSKLSEATLSDVQKELQEREQRLKENLAKKQQRLKVIHSEEQKVAQCVKEEREDLTLERQSSRNNEAFADEFSSLLQVQSSVPLKQSTDNRSFFQLFDSDEKVVVAHLKAHLGSVLERENTEEREIVLDPLLLLQKDFGVRLEAGLLVVHCAFGWNYKEMGTEVEAQSGVELVSKIALVREGGHLWGVLQAVQGAEAEEFCSARMAIWLQQTLQSYS